MASSSFRWVYNVFASIFGEIFRKLFRSHLVTQFDPENAGTEINSSSGSRGYDVFPSCGGEDVRKSFPSHILKKLHCKSISIFRDLKDMIKRCLKVTSEIFSIRELRMQAHYKNSDCFTWRLNRAWKIQKRFTKNFDQMVVPVMHDVDPSDVREQTGEIRKVVKVTCEDKREDQKQSRRYDIFPSFSGEDVRKSFLSHLLKEFDRKSINTFNDHGIERSRPIASELLTAIEDSSISIVVFSKHYASSTWCLNELVKIHECYKKLDQMVIPVFYDVNPSNVRKQTGEFGKVFRVTCEGKTEDQKQRWVQALVDVGNMAGEDLHNWSSEALMLEKIANDVSNKLISPPNSYGEFVGIEAHLEEMESILCLDSKEARMVGIWGTSGIGKSTIGRALFSQLSGQFPFRNFTTYRKSTDEDVSGMKSSWEQKFLSEILSQKDIKIEHFGVVEKRLKDKKVLIILDDVDNLEFLKTLVGKTEWFGPGSRIIVITQDRRLLKAHDIDLLYEVEFPSQDLALKMLCRSAFDQDSPPDGFKELAAEVATLAGNLPLGLSVLGSYLKGRERKEWHEMLPELQNGLDGNIMKTLRVSYDRLATKDQNILHYIAWLFNGDGVESINDFLGDDYTGLKTLADKSLVSITQDERVEMHSLLEKFGREIDRAESKGNPGKRRFLDDTGEILDVFTDKTGTETMLGIYFNESSPSQIEMPCISLDETSFDGMLNLQFLIIYDIKSRLRLPRGLAYLPRKLKLLDWRNYPLKCLPSNFKVEYLVELRMEHSKLEKLWEGTQLLGSLKTLIMRNSKCLKKIPDLSKAINLKKVDISNCDELKIFPTPLNSESLEYLNLQACPRLKNFPEIIMNSSCNGIEIEVEDCLWNKTLPGIEYLYCFRGSNPSKFRPEHLVSLTVVGNMLEKLWEGVQSLGSLLEMNLSDCGRLTEIPDLSKAINLQSLFLSRCKSLVKFPSTIGNLQKLVKLEMKECTWLKVLPVDVNLSSLETLDLSGCSNLRSFPQISKRFCILYLDDTAIEEVPCCFEMHPRLFILSMQGCKKLNKFSLISNSIEILHLGDTAIEEVPCCFEMLPRLCKLSMQGCKKLKRFSMISSSIEILNLGDTAIEEVPSCIEMLPRLIELKMYSCKKLKNISPNIFCLTCLKEVDFTDCEGVTTVLSKAIVVATMENHYETIEEGNNVETRCNREKDKDEDEDEDDEYEKYFIFQNCLKLDGDARQLILQSCFNSNMILPGGEVPTYFEHRAYGNSLTVTLSRSSLLQEMLQLNACIVVDPQPDYFAYANYEELAYTNSCHVDFDFSGKHYKHAIALGGRLRFKTDHLVLCSFKFRPTGLPSKLDFHDVEFKFSYARKIKQCGIRVLNVSSYPDDRDGSSKTEPCLMGEALCIDSMITEQQDAQIPIAHMDLKPSSSSRSASASNSSSFWREGFPKYFNSGGTTLIKPESKCL